MIRGESNKEYFFILYLKRPKSEEANDKVEFTNSGDKNKDKDNIPKCIQTKEENDQIVKIFKFSSKLIKDNKLSFKFLFDSKKYQVNLENLKDKTFIFDADITINGKKLEQTKKSYSEKMNYFDEALSTQKEYEKLKILYLDSINLCNRKPSFHFLINIFVKVYNTELCSKLLEIFTKKIEKFLDNTNKELQKYKCDLQQIFENREQSISKYSLDQTDFYGLILCYMFICNNEKYRELFDILSKTKKTKRH